MEAIHVVDDDAADKMMKEVHAREAMSPDGVAGKTLRKCAHQLRRVP